LKAKEALIDLHRKDVPFSHIQKAFSVGTMGVDKRRRLVPTRWSITACDSTIADELLREVKHHDPLDVHRVYEFQSLSNYYAVLLLPTPWQYEWMEAFLEVLGREKIIFSDSNITLAKQNTQGWEVLLHLQNGSIGTLHNKKPGRSNSSQRGILGNIPFGCLM
jgi:hypothetical protein